VHEKPVSLKAFQERRTRWYGGGEFRGHPFPQKKMNLGLAEMQFPAVLMAYTFQSLLGRFSITFSIHPIPIHPQYFYANLDETHIFKWGFEPPPQTFRGSASAYNNE